MAHRSLKFITALLATGFGAGLTTGLLAVPTPAQAGELIQLGAFSLPQAQVPALTAPEFPTQPSEALMPLRLQIRLSQRRVTLYRGDQVVKNYPIAVGRPGWETPQGTFQVQQMIRNPAWVHPLEQGVLIPGGDPENPLGRYWIGFWTNGKNWIGFHGTPNPKSVGTPASHGCIRMYSQDIEDLFSRVHVGTEVSVVQ